MSTNPDVHQLLQKAWIAGAASAELINAAEYELGIQFPPSYRQFLSQYGAVMCEEVEIVGLFLNENEDEPPLWSDIVSRTKNLRCLPGSSVVDDNWPRSYLPISSDGTDYMFYLDESQSDESGECPVIVLGPGADGIVVASDVFDFIVRSFEGTLSF